MRDAPRPRRVCCTNADCENHKVSVTEHPQAYRKFGFVSINGERRNPRRQCKSCLNTFVMPVLQTRYKKVPMVPEDALLLKLLVGKMPVRRILETLQIPPSVFYTRLKHFDGAFRALGRQHEAGLPAVLAGQPVCIGVDRQEYLLNWTDRHDKRNVRLLAVGSADNASGYVLGHHLNYDVDADPEAVQRESSADLTLLEPYRRHARLWLQQDYARAQLRSGLRKAPAGEAGAGTRRGIEQRYREALTQVNIEEPEAADAGRAPQGMQVHSSYTLYGHFLYLRRLLEGAGEVGFYLDQDSGMHTRGRQGLGGPSWKRPRG